MLIAGVDEVGRGPLAGPVLACAVILDPRYSVEGLDDSKKLSEKKREILNITIKQRAKCYAFGWASVREIDTINILQASLLAMKRAVERLGIVPDKVLVDGNHCPLMSTPAEAIIGGDSCVPVISAASIVAKVARDRLMGYFDKRFPQYGFAKHKGYPTRQHLEALDAYGILNIHRTSFGPVRERLTKRS